MRGFLLCLILTACAAATIIDVGCNTYGKWRVTMPAVPDTPFGEWFALLDSDMTGACRK